MLHRESLGIPPFPGGHPPKDGKRMRPVTPVRGHGHPTAGNAAPTASGHSIHKVSRTARYFLRYSNVAERCGAPTSGESGGRRKSSGKYHRGVF
jgi:hypothetical protein